VSVDVKGKKLFLYISQLYRGSKRTVGNTGKDAWAFSPENAANIY